MKAFQAVLVAALFVFSTGVALARVNTDAPPTLKVTQAPKAGWLEDDIPARALGAAKTDTIRFGSYEDRYAGTDSAAPYAVLGGMWTFDHGAADPLEGWTSEDVTSNPVIYWRPITQALWDAEGNGLAWPAMNGAGMVLCGATLSQAQLLSWAKGVGYGGNWCQTLTGPDLLYDGSGDVTLSLKYFSESEIGYDYTKIYVESGGYGEIPYQKVLLNGPHGFDATEPNGIDALGVIGAGAVVDTILIPAGSISGDTLSTSQPFRIIVEFKSDGGVSDEDGPLDSFYGAVGLDDITVTGNLVSDVSYTFDDGTLEGWTAATWPGIGTFMGLTSMAECPIDPCRCSLVGNVLEMHNDDPGNMHPNGQHEALSSPIVDRKGDIGAGYLAYNRIIAKWDQYADMPQANGVFYRPGWKYYPYSPPALPNLVMWSPRIGQDTWHYGGDMAVCYGTRAIGTDWGLPTNAEKVKFVYEINSNCDSFGISNCTHVTNFSPILDNIQVCNVEYVNAPVAVYEPGTRFQDGFGMGSLGVLSTTDAGNADIAYNLRMGSPPGTPTRLGDSLMIAGPWPSSIATKWEAKMWFRLRREGPGQASNAKFTNEWKPAMGANVNYPNFAWGYMDSVEIGGAQRSKFCSYFRELAPAGGLTSEPKFSWGSPGTTDKDADNEILPDGVFTPGTKIEYFITTNWIPSPTAYYFYPDTTGGVYSEFEILPSFRNVGGVAKFPCVLYVDAFNGGAQPYIENALNVVLNGAGTGAPIPDLTSWDRYDYLDASSNWHGTLYRDPNGNSGMTIAQMMGYRLTLVSLGNAGTAMWPRDWQGFSAWLAWSACCGNLNPQGFIVDGTSAAQIIQQSYSSLLSGILGATYACPAYREAGCLSGETENDQQNCVRVEPVRGSPFGTGVASDVFGNGCPLKTSFNVLGTTGTGFGNKAFEKINSFYQTSYAQVINDKSGGGSNYRSVIESFSYHLLTSRNSDDPGLNECAYAAAADDSAARMAAACKEIENAIKWTLNVRNPQAEIGLRVDPCSWDCSNAVDEDVPAAAVTRLYQNRPNPFNPRTVVRFSLAEDGPAKLIIYDVNGRRIRTLVDKGLKAGVHEVVWDGSDDSGRAVTSGVYWSQLQAGSYASNKKMVVLK
jgi:hypothetical protein